MFTHDQLLSLADFLQLWRGAVEDSLPAVDMKTLKRKLRLYGLAQIWAAESGNQVHGTVETWLARFERWRMAGASSAGSPTIDL